MLRRWRCMAGPTSFALFGARANAFVLIGALPPPHTLAECISGLSFTLRSDSTSKPNPWGENLIQNVPPGHFEEAVLEIRWLKDATLKSGPQIPSNAGFFMQPLSPNSGRCPRPDRDQRPPGPGFAITMRHGTSLPTRCRGSCFEQAAANVAKRAGQQNVNSWEAFKVKCPTCVVRVSSFFSYVRIGMGKSYLRISAASCAFSRGRVITPETLKRVRSHSLKGLGWDGRWFR